MGTFLTGKSFASSHSLSTSQTRSGPSPGLEVQVCRMVNLSMMLSARLPSLGSATERSRVIYRIDLVQPGLYSCRSKHFPVLDEIGAGAFAEAEDLTLGLFSWSCHRTLLSKVGQ